jgi:hypothetical protein
MLKKINMDDYQFYLSARVQWLGPLNRTAYHVYYVGASSGPMVGTLTAFTSWDGVFHVHCFSSNLKWNTSCGSWKHVAHYACL